MAQAILDPKFQSLLEQLQQQAPQLVDTFLSTLSTVPPSSIHNSSPTKSSPTSSPLPTSFPIDDQIALKPSSTNLSPTSTSSTIPTSQSPSTTVFFPIPTSTHHSTELTNELNDFSHIEFVQQLELLGSFHTQTTQSVTPIEMHIKLASISKSSTPAIFTAISTDAKYIAIYDNKDVRLFYLDDIFPHVTSTQMLQGNTQVNFHTSFRPQRATSQHQKQTAYLNQGPQGVMHQTTPITTWSLPSPSFIPRCIKIHPVEDVVFVLCTNNTMLIYTRGHPIPLHIHDFDDISSFDIHPTGKYMLLASKETPLIKLYDLTTFSCSIPVSSHSLCTTEPPIITKSIDNPSYGKNNTMMDTDSNKEQNKGQSQKFENDLPLIQSTQLPQFPVFAVKYSPFGQYFASICISPQITQSTLPIIQVRVYNAIDHSLFNSFDLPLQYHLHELSYLQHYNPIQTQLQPLPNGQLPLFDLDAAPISIEWSQNEQFFLITTPFQPQFQLPIITQGLPDYPTQAQPLTPSITAHLYRVQTAQHIFSYHIDSQFDHIYPNASKSHNITPQPLPLGTSPNNAPTRNQTHPYSGYKAFFSPDSQYVFIASEGMSAGINTDSLCSFTHVFQTSTGKLLKQVENKIETPAQSTVQLPAYVSSNVNQQHNAGNETKLQDSRKSHLLPTLQPYYGGMRFAPLSILPDGQSFRYYIFTMSGHTIAIDYQPVAIFEQNNTNNDEDSDGAVNNGLYMTTQDNNDSDPAIVVDTLNEVTIDANTNKSMVDAVTLTQ